MRALKTRFVALSQSLAASSGFVDILKICLSDSKSAAAIVQKATQSGDTPLHWAAQESQLECCKLLLANKARCAVS